MKKASDWLIDMIARHASRPVIYRRGTQELSVMASIGRTLLKLDDGFGVRMEWTDRDFLIAAAELAMFVPPQRGDRIIEGGEIYEVLAPGREPVWRRSDVDGRLLRIHTKRIGSQ